MKLLTKLTPTATQNACKACAPLGACLAFRGIEAAIPLIHGSQGCATYIRRYLIGHFREPVDVASSSFSEGSAIFGGKDNLFKALSNVISQYNPQFIGVASSCLTETIGDDLERLVPEFESQLTGDFHPALVPVATPSYAGTHDSGFHSAVHSIIDRLAIEPYPGFGRAVNIMPGILSPADIRYLKEILEDFGLVYTMLPDYSDTLDAPAASTYEPIPRGGTPISSIASMGRAAATLVLSSTLSKQMDGGALLETRFGVPEIIVGAPIGIGKTDVLFNILSDLSGRKIPPKYVAERGRLIDSYVDAHKYLFGKKAVIYGEEGLVIGLTSFLAEIGVFPVVCASGGKGNGFQAAIRNSIPAGIDQPTILEGADFSEITAAATTSGADFLVGNSGGYGTSQRLGIPLIRVGFPVLDRTGGQRILHVGYRGAQHLFDQIVNELLRKLQDDSPVGYGHF